MRPPTERGAKEGLGHRGGAMRGMNYPRELRVYGVLRSSRPDPEIATWHTKILHMGDALHPARLLAYLCEVTRGLGPKTLRPPHPQEGACRRCQRKRAQPRSHWPRSLWGWCGF